MGSLESWVAGRAVDLGPPKQRAVLAVLLVEANRVVSLDRLIELLWGDDAPARATGALQVYVSGLRRVLEPGRPARSPSQVLVTQAPGYLLRAGRDDVDAWRFEHLAAEGRKRLAEGRPAEARRALGEALGLWRGEPLAEFASESFAWAEAVRLEELRASTLEDRIEADLALGDHAAVTCELEGLVSESPLRERRWALLMLALYRSHRQADALRAAARARDILVGELGVEPGPLLRDLEADILNQSPSLDWRPPSETAAAVSPAAVQGAPREDASAETAEHCGGLIGRESEVHQLQVALARAHRGQSGLVLISGEPGIGKSRLAEELTDLAAAQGATVGCGRGQEGGRALSFWPWVQVVRGLLQAVEPDRLRAALRPRAADLMRVVPEVGTVLPEVEPAPPAAPDVARFRLRHAVAATLGELARTRPLVVALEDLHWADVPSLRLLEFVAEHTAGSALLLAVTYRDVDPAVAEPLAETLGALARHPGVVRLPLRGLSRPEVGRFMARTAGSVPADEVIDAVHHRTDGNPFFVAELTRLLASERALGGGAPRHGHIPDAVRDVVRRRLARLPERTNELLVLAAVLGRDVDVTVLAAAGGIDEAQVLDLLDASVAVGILGEDPERTGHYCFSHAIVQETILGEVGGARRAQLHARAAVGLERVHGDDDSRAVEVAHHLRAAIPVVEVDRAITATLRAAEVAQRRLAYEVAELALQRALVTVVRLPPEERTAQELEIQHRLAALLSITAGYQSAQVAEAWGRARDLARHLGDTPEVLSSLWGLARLSRTRGEFAASLELGQQLLDLAEGSRVTAFAVAGHETLGLAAFFMGDPEAAADHLTVAVSLSDGPEFSAGSGTLVLDPRVSDRAYLACARWMLGQGPEADALSTEAIALAAEHGNPIDQAIAFLYASKLATLRERPEQAGEAAAEVHRLAQTGAMGPLASVGSILAAWAGAHTGGAAEAEAAVEAAMAQLRAADWRLAWTYFLVLRADIHRLAGHLDVALRTVEEGLEEAATTGERYEEPELLRLGGEVAVAAGRPRQEAEGWFQRAVDRAASQGSVAFRAKAEASLARLAAE